MYPMLLRIEGVVTTTRSAWESPRAFAERVNGGDIGDGTPHVMEKVRRDDECDEGAIHMRSMEWIEDWCNRGWIGVNQANDA
jgi:hypothetical protein